MNTRYTKAEFLSKYDNRNDEDKEHKDYRALEKFFKHIDRKTSIDSKRRNDFFDFFSIDKSLIQGENLRYQIPFEIAELLAGLIRSYSAAYGTDQRKAKAGNSFAFSYKDYHLYMERLHLEMKKMQPYQRELIKAHRSYRNAVIADRFLPMVTERIAMLMNVLFCYEPDQSSDDFIAVIDQLDRLIEAIFNSRSERNTANEDRTLKREKYTFEDAISSVFRILADDTYIFSKEERGKFTSPELVENILKVKKDRSLKKNAKSVSKGASLQEIRERKVRKLNKVATYLTEKSRNFEKQLDDAASSYEKFWSENNLSNKRLHDIVMAERAHAQKAFDMALGLGDYAEMANDIGNCLMSRVIDDIENNHSTALRDSLEDYYVYKEFQDWFPIIRSRARAGHVAKKGLAHIRAEFVEEQCNLIKTGAKVDPQVKFYNIQRNRFCQYAQTARNSSTLKSIQNQLNEAIAQLLPTHFSGKK